MANINKSVNFSTPTFPDLTLAYLTVNVAFNVTLTQTLSSTFTMKSPCSTAGFGVELTAEKLSKNHIIK